MKEAAGEANLTVVAVILVAVVVAIATPLVSSMMKTAAYRTCCTDAGLIWKNGKCQGTKTMACSEVDSKFYNEYDKCVIDNGLGATANQHYVYVCGS